MSFEFAAVFRYSANDNEGALRSRTTHITGRTHTAQLRIEALRFILWQAVSGGGHNHDDN
jgi:hypothetical protein